MNSQLQLHLALDRHRQLLKEAENERMTCCVPRIQLSWPRLKLFAPARSACPTC